MLKIKDIQEPLYTADDLAEKFNVDREVIYRLRKSGQLRGIKIGANERNHVRFTESAVNEFLARCNPEPDEKREEEGENP